MSITKSNRSGTYIAAALVIGGVSVGGFVYSTDKDDRTIVRVVVETGETAHVRVNLRSNQRGALTLHNSDISRNYTDDVPINRGELATVSVRATPSKDTRKRHTLRCTIYVQGNTADTRSLTIRPGVAASPINCSHVVRGG